MISIFGKWAYNKCDKNAAKVKVGKRCLDDSVYEISHRQSWSYEAGFQCSFTRNPPPPQNMTIFIYISLRNCPGRLSSFRRFDACCDDARHCEQNGVVFEANFFAIVLEVHPRALELYSAWAS